MPKVTFLPMNVTVDALKGESVLDVALNSDIPLEHACGGFCSCTTCHIKVIGDAEDHLLSPMEEEEKERIQDLDQLTPQSRLGCQAQILGDVTVVIQNLSE